jgi:glutamine synthetase
MAEEKYTLPPCFGTVDKIGALLDPSIRREFMSLDQDGSITVEYVWIGGTGQDMRSKTRTITKAVTTAAELPNWNYDGSSCGQAPGEDSEVYLVPRQIYKDPFR